MADYTERANQKLVEAINRFKESEGRDKEAQNVISEELISNAEFIMPARTVEDPKEGKKTLYGVVAFKDARPFYTLFTSKEKLKSWNKSIKHSETEVNKFDMIADLAFGDDRIFGLVVNPGTDDFIIARPVISQLRARMKGIEGGLEGEKAHADDDVTFQDVRQDEVTEELQNALVMAMRNNDNVTKGYLRDMIRNGNLDYLVVIEHTGSMNETFTKIMDICKNHSHGRSVALISSKAPVADRAIEGAEPIYSK
ncbi:enhanced serine sensitivity protein SseB C-terminal domain-containing protein [Oribacterium sp. WCC10]|uniref:enhanced serine sensitivity protein SseB C-terminal domain-containing protein n=1 Tax=Oribacterium sp. WCC10 TaxID=1855343 RepID=UPI0008EF690D|nr:enhanced serine sensitivity protein SseB C-terminal domain-containing protein [Oribacterium sp. WCC10]SFG38034.1 SseB protein N-terminal domain-containing protein [Oribacterium sp. WCC10]